ncbi:MAG: ABC transporter permease [Chloroflexales bacterium]|nr:ABC transporter permease [Chloroflexales bacterium]
MTTPHATTTLSRGPGAFLSETWALYQRAVRKLVRRPVILYFSLVQPLIWLLLFGQVFSRITETPGFGAAFGGQSYLAFFAPAVILQTILFGAGQSGLGLLNDLDSGFLSKLLTTPINRLAILLGKVLGDLTRMLFQAVIILIITFLAGLRFGEGGVEMTISYFYGIPGIIGALAIALLFGVMLAGLNVAIALMTRNTEATFLIANFLTFPLLFTSSALLPVQVLPGWLQSFSQFNPVTYTIDALRALLYGPSIVPAGETVAGMALQAVVVLGILAALTLAWGTSRFRKAVV